MNKTEGFSLIVAIIALIFSLPIIGPALSFLGGWISAHIILWILGPNAPAVLAVFSPKITVELFPLVFGVLACIGRHFRSYTSTSSQK